MEEAREQARGQDRVLENARGLARARVQAWRPDRASEQAREQARA